MLKMFLAYYMFIISNLQLNGSNARYMSTMRKKKERSKKRKKSSSFTFWKKWVKLLQLIQELEVNLWKMRELGTVHFIEIQLVAEIALVDNLEKNQIKIEHYWHFTSGSKT